MNGLGMLLKSFGIEIDPKEAVKVFELFRADAAQLPQFIANVTALLVSMEKRLSNLEENFGHMLAELREMGGTNGGRIEPELQQPESGRNSGRIDGPG